MKSQNQQPHIHDLIIIGAGAAGLTAAYFASEFSDDVLLLERTNKAGKKILISGGTRCNVLPVKMEYDDYFTDSSKNLMKRVFKSWSLDRCKDWLQWEIGLNLNCEVESNKWFPTSNSAKEVRDKLLDGVKNGGVEVRYGHKIIAINRSTDGIWTIQPEKQPELQAKKVILATGGCSIPTMGTDGIGQRILQQLGIPVTELYPALTPLLCRHPGNEPIPGLSLETNVTAADPEISYTAKRTGFLFTHKGISGPAVLDISHISIRHHFDQKKTTFEVNWLREDPQDVDNWLQSINTKVVNALKEKLPNRLAEALAEDCNLTDRWGPELRKEERKELVEKLTAYQLKITGTEGYKKAEVTGGGVPLEEIDTATMELKKLPGLYLCGEIIDVFGRIGGFNFYWAWLTGRLAGMKAVG